MIETHTYKEKIRQSGHCIIENVFDTIEINDLRASITGSIDRIAKNLLIPYEMSYPEASFNERLELAAQKDPSYTNAIITSLYADGHLAEPINGIYNHKKIQSLVQELILPHPNQKPTIRIRVSLCSQLDKLQPWHSDVVNPAKTGCGSNKLTCWIPLQDINPENGSLEIINKSFDEPFTHQINSGQFAISENQLSNFPTSTIECKAGDVVFLDRFTPHRSLKNLTSSVRWSIVLWIKGFDENEN